MSGPRVLLLGVYLIGLGWWSHGGAGPEATAIPVVRDFGTGADALAWAGRMVLAAAAEMAAFAGLGALAVWAFERTGDRRSGLARTLLWPAAAVLVTAAVVRGLTPGPGWAPPRAIALSLPVLGGLAGIGIGLAWRGRLGRLLPALAVAGLAAAAAAGGLVYAATETTPRRIEPEAFTAADKRRLYRLLDAPAPARLEPDETFTVRLGERDVNLLLAWARSVSTIGGAARITLDGGGVEVVASSRVPGLPGPRYLNLRAAGRVAVEDGEVQVDVSRFRAGRVEVPTAMLRLASPLAARVVAADGRVGSLLRSVRSLRVEGAEVALTYGHARLPGDLLADLYHGPSAGGLGESVEAQLRSLTRSARGLPEGDARTRGAVEVAFGLARQRSSPETAVLENRAAVAALGIALGHPGLGHFFSPAVDPAESGRAARAYRRATMRSRRDWTRHFFVSAALAVLSTAGASDVAGLLKEEQDADGGSGFSFGDLLADRAGTRFALLATRDEASAGALQERVARGFRVEDYLPEAAGLPEGIGDRELRERFGGVGGPEYRKMTEEIERRISRLEAYGGLPPR